MIELSSGW